MSLVVPIAIYTPDETTPNTHHGSEPIPITDCQITRFSSNDGASPRNVESAQRMEERHDERQFLLKADKFIQAWMALAHEYNQKGGFNVKKAKEASKAFHDLEKSEGWLKADAQ
jgi:hypothetical protein